MQDRFFGEIDSYLFHRGTHYEIFEKMGAHPDTVDGVRGVRFALWAPSARAVCVVHDGNGWTKWADVMHKTDDSVWELFIPGMTEGVRYKYLLVRADGSEVMKTDPYGFYTELRPANASIVYDLSRYEWNDAEWPENRKGRDPLSEPMSVYEVHLGSWKKDTDKRDGDRFLNYRRLAAELAEYVCYMGYTHVELMGICEYPFDPSWGYQVTGYYSPTSRYGTPDDLMYFIDTMHSHGIGVILDWVPAHFPKDENGLSDFDGTPLYEFSDPLRAEYPEWGTKAFDLGKKEVSNFLIGSALFWINKYHVDALRVDAVAAMMYNSFSREEWRPNMYGGNTNLESFEFFRHLNSILKERTDAYLIAEDSSALPGITAPTSEGGFGFGFKWNMGWMNDTLRYAAKDPIYRKYHHGLMTHTLDYVFDERFILVLSHDEVVYGKGSMLNKFPGSLPDRFGSLKTFYTMMAGHPGKKLLFMGQDFAQEKEWDYRSSLDWHLCDDPGHREVMDCVRELNRIYRSHPVLYSDGDRRSFEWINGSDATRSTFSFIRRNPWNYNNALIFVCNFTPQGYRYYDLGVPADGVYRRIFCTYPDGREYKVKSYPDECDGRPYRITIELRPYESVIIEAPERGDNDKQAANAEGEENG